MSAEAQVKVGNFFDACHLVRDHRGVVYFAFVLPVNALWRASKSLCPSATLHKACPECLSEIPMAAKRAPLRPVSRLTAALQW